MDFYLDTLKFWDNLLFNGVNPMSNLIILDGDFIRFTLTTEHISIILTIITIGLYLYTAYFVIKWFINFILSLGGK